MSLALIIPDCHLKPLMFDLAEDILEAGQADFAVQLGDLVDDWGQEFNLPLYSRTMERVLKFYKKHPNTLWCMGNHDFGYYHPDFGRRETGHSKFVEGEMKTWLDEFKRAGLVQKPVHIVDNCVFSHAGLTEDWMQRQLTLVGFPYLEKAPVEENILRIANNAATDELWLESSPIWARPQMDHYDMYCPDRLQVVGHTPMHEVKEEDGILSTDVFSTNATGYFLGSKQFVIVDTITKEWKLTDEDRYTLSPEEVEITVQRLAMHDFMRRAEEKGTDKKEVKDERQTN